MAIQLELLGDTAWLARFERESEAAAWAGALRKTRLPGVLEVVTSYLSVAVFADPDHDDLDTLGQQLRTLEGGGQPKSTERRVDIPVLYDGEDLEPVAERLGLSIGDVIDLHSQRDYQVYAIGFIPGFPYAGYLADELARLPRRGSPRTRVPAGSVAIAGRQTGVYPSESPGGWHLLGRTPLRLIDLDRAYFPIRVGDLLRFSPIDLDTFLGMQGNSL